MYHYYKDKIFLKYPELENHIFFKTFIKMVEVYNSEKLKENENEIGIEIGNEIGNGIINEKENGNTIKYTVIDEIFSKYLIEVYGECNKEYFEFIAKFVILFRECINKIKVDNSLEDFSAVKNADNVPDTCNEFITDFMENYDYFGMDTMELIEIIQHLCNWLYENKFTTSKLSLVS